MDFQRDLSSTHISPRHSPVQNPCRSMVCVLAKDLHHVENRIIHLMIIITATFECLFCAKSFQVLFLVSSRKPHEQVLTFIPILQERNQGTEQWLPWVRVTQIQGCPSLLTSLAGADSSLVPFYFSWTYTPAKCAAFSPLLAFAHAGLHLGYTQTPDHLPNPFQCHLLLVAFLAVSPVPQPSSQSQSGFCRFLCHNSRTDLIVS